MCAPKGDPRDDQPDLKLLCMSCVSNLDATSDQEKQSSTSWHNSLRATHQRMSTEPRRARLYRVRQKGESAYWKADPGFRLIEDMPLPLTSSDLGIL